VGGRLLFAGLALVVSIPFMLRIYRRFGTCGLCDFLRGVRGAAGVLG
jgi:hypothetical protein